MKHTHIDCQDINCKICLRDHLSLGMKLDELTGDRHTDHLGKFHKFLSDNGIEPETETGWGTRAYFDDDNIADYVEFMSRRT